MEAGPLTTWPPQIFETNTFDLITRDDVAGRAKVLVRSEKELQAITPWRISWIRVQCRLSWPAEHFSFSRSLRSGPFGSRNGCGEQTPLTCEIRPRCAPHVGVPARCRLTTGSEPFEFASEKSRGFLCGFVCIRLWSISSVAIGNDSDANTRRADADAATLPIAPRSI